MLIDNINHISIKNKIKIKMYNRTASLKSIFLADCLAQFADEIAFRHDGHAIATLMHGHITRRAYHNQIIIQ